MVKRERAKLTPSLASYVATTLIYIFTFQVYYVVRLQINMKTLKTKFVFLLICVIFVNFAFVDRSSFLQNPKRYVLVSDEITRRKDIFDTEYERFQERMKNWNHEKPKGAIIVLTQPNRIHYLQRALRNLDTYFLNNFSYPIIIFHEIDYRPYIDTVRTWTNASVFFQEIKFEIPSFLNMSKIPELIQNRTVGKVYISSMFVHVRRCSQFGKNVERSEANYRGKDGH